MTHNATDRLTVAVALSLIGALVAVLAGMPEVALFVAPWLVLCALGMTRGQRIDVRTLVTCEQDRLLVGDPADVAVQVEVTSPAYVEVTPQPGSAYGERLHEAPLGIIDVATPRRPAEIRFEIEANEWGTLDVGPMKFVGTTPYGLFKMEGSLVNSQLIRVHPTPQQLRELLTPTMVRRVSGTHRSRESAQGIEYADLREFGPGDSVRDINWRASARSPDLWVSQRHPDRATDVLLLVDSFVESGHNVSKVFGMVVEAAVAMAESHLGATDRVGLIEFGGLVRWVTPGTGRVQLQRLTDALLATGLYANAADKTLPVLPPKALPPRSFIVAFSPLLDQRFVDAVFTARQRGHDVAVVECAPFWDGDEDDVAAQLANRVWQAERAVVRDQMAEYGIAVASWDGTHHIDVTLAELARRRRRTVRMNGR